MLAKCKKAYRTFAQKERGEIMLEGMIVMIITMLMLVWILGVGFVYYQRYTMTIVTNDVAAKIASTFRNPDSDVFMGYIDTQAITGRDLYRGSSAQAAYLVSANQNRATNYVKYILDKANFNNTIQDVDVALELVQDSNYRRHIQITTTCTFNTPFGEGLEVFGMSGQRIYTATACADCTDIAEYISGIDFYNYLGTGSYLGSEKVIQNYLKLINTIIDSDNKLNS